MMMSFHFLLLAGEWVDLCLFRVNDHVPLFIFSLSFSNLTKMSLIGKDELSDTLNFKIIKIWLKIQNQDLIVKLTSGAPWIFVGWRNIYTFSFL